MLPFKQYDYLKQKGADSIFLKNANQYNSLKEAWELNKTNYQFQSDLLWFANIDFNQKLQQLLVILQQVKEVKIVNTEDKLKLKSYLDECIFLVQQKLNNKHLSKEIEKILNFTWKNLNANDKISDPAIRGVLDFIKLVCSVLSGDKSEFRDAVVEAAYILSNYSDSNESLISNIRKIIPNPYKLETERLNLDKDTTEPWKDILEEI